MTALGMLLAGLGIILAWSAFRGVDPRTLIGNVIRP